MLESYVWEFVRSASRALGDSPTLVKTQGTLWRQRAVIMMEGDEDAPSELPQPELVWLTPGEVMNHSLTDKLRLGLATEETSGIELAPEEQAQRDAEAEEQAKLAPAEWAQQMDAHTEDWRWSVVDGMVAVDNQPAIDKDRARQEQVGGPPLVEYRSVVLPLEVVLAIGDNLPKREPQGVATSG